jgi:hypothetical protein
MQDRRYDVAISFLSQDEPLARKLREDLSEHLSVFLSPMNQQQVAGTDGLETFRVVFRSQCRLALVLYRDGWGKTPWTRVEEQAMQERMLHEGWKVLLFVKIDPRSELPIWIPENAMYLNYADYSTDLLGAIKLRVQELGGELKTETAAGKAQRMRAVALAKAERESKLAIEARNAFPLEWAELRRVIGDKVAEIKPDFVLENEADTRTFVAGEVEYMVRTVLASLRLLFRPVGAESHIVAETYIGRLLFGDERRALMYPPGDGPQILSTTKYYFDWNAAYDWCWRNEKGELHTTDSFCELLLKTLLEIHRKIDAGEIQKRSRQDIHRTAWS